MSAPFLADPDVTLWHGDALETLRGIAAGSVDMVATSPPFYGLRDYGVDGQIGLEDTPDEWVARLVAVFTECRRVLRDNGTLWVEIGDSYNTATSTSRGASTLEGSQGYWANPHLKTRLAVADLKPKDLLGQPWMLAFALRADGWYLRSEIVWARPNAMPESVTDRPTKAHSIVFLLSKRPRYFYDADALRTPYQYDGRKVTTVEGRDGSAQHRNGKRWPGIGNARARRDVGKGGHDESEPMEVNHAGANARSVWSIPTEPTPFAHFATWPQALVRRMILAGCPEGGTVLDPFAGSGTTLLVARKHGRRSVGIELNETYCQIAARRLQQLSLLAEASS